MRIFRVAESSGIDAGVVRVKESAARRVSRPPETFVQTVNVAGRAVIDSTRSVNTLARERGAGDIARVMNPIITPTNLCIAASTVIW
jgi:hypothetical protein